MGCFDLDLSNCDFSDWPAPEIDQDDHYLPAVTHSHGSRSVTSLDVELSDDPYDSVTPPAQPLYHSVQSLQLQLTGSQRAHADLACTCANDECGRAFVPHNSLQRYCSMDCKRTAQKRRKRALYNAMSPDERRIQNAHNIATWKRSVSERRTHCQGCGTMFISRYRRIYCSRECSRSALKRRAAKTATN